jgi:hypothetical protein
MFWIIDRWWWERKRRKWRNEDEAVCFSQRFVGSCSFRVRFTRCASLLKKFYLFFILFFDTTKKRSCWSCSLMGALTTQYALVRYIPLHRNVNTTRVLFMYSVARLSYDTKPSPREETGLYITTRTQPRRGQQRRALASNKHVILTRIVNLFHIARLFVPMCVHWYSTSPNLEISCVCENPSCGETSDISRFI